MLYNKLRKIKWYVYTIKKESFNKMKYYTINNQKKYEKHKTLFLKTFGIDLINFWNMFFGFDIIKFDDYLISKYKNEYTQGKYSTETFLQEKFGEKTKDLIKNLL